MSRHALLAEAWERMTNFAMAFKIIFCSCLVAAIAYLTYQELTVITDSYSLEIVVPAKRSDVFRLLLDPKFVLLKFHPMW